MKIEKQKLDNSYILHLTENCFVDFYNDWKQIFGKWNWHTFHFIHIYFENDIMCPGYEFEFVILGLGFRIRINRDWEGTEIKKRIDRIKKNENIPPKI